MNNPLTTAPVPKLLRSIAVPVSVGFFFNTMYNVVDTYFGGLHSDQALAALSLSFPVFFLIIATGSGISTGLTALIANAYGEGNPGKASRIAGQGLSFTAVSSVVLTITGLIISAPLFGLLGASGTYLELALSYMHILFYGTAGFMFLFALNAFLTAMGDTKSYRNFLIAGFFLNFLFNTWFMFGGLGIPPLGLAGVALGTVVVQLIGIAYLAYQVRTANIFIGPLGWHELKPDWKEYKEILSQGLPASLSMMTIALGVFIITYFLSGFGEAAVAAFGIAQRIEQIMLLLIIGLNVAVLTLVGQNFGARRFDRIRETYAIALRYGAVISAAALIFIYGGARTLMRLFTDDAAIIDIGTAYLHIAAFVMGGYAILFISDALLRGLKKPMFFLFVGIMRQIVLPLTLFTLLIRYFDMGIGVIWWGILGIVWSAALVAFWYARRTLARIESLS